MRHDLEYLFSCNRLSVQLPVKNWFDYINEPTIADAIMDRLTAKSSKIELSGKSLRRSS